MESLLIPAPILLPLRDEHGVEFYYNVAVTPSCQITPDLQVITPFRERAGSAGRPRRLRATLSTLPAHDDLPGRRPHPSFSGPICRKAVR